MTQQTRPGREAIVRALKKHSLAKITEATIEAHGTSLQHESDRGTVIMTAAMIEDTLTQALERRFSHLTRKEIDAMFDFNGPMGTFSAKIKCAQAFGIIDRATRNHVEMVREMRNACAHSQNALTFKDDILRNAVFSMLSEEDANNFKDDHTYVRIAFVLMTGVIANIIIEEDVLKGTAKVNNIIQQTMAELAADKAEGV